MKSRRWRSFFGCYRKCCVEGGVDPLDVGTGEAGDRRRREVLASVVLGVQGSRQEGVLQGHYLPL